MPQNSPPSSPLGGPPPPEVPLARAPLARVLAQVRFPTVLFIEERARIAPLQAAIRGEYPIFREETGQNLQVDLGQPGPTIRTTTATLWRFADVKGDWTVTLGPESVTLETKAYASREAFLDRLRRVLGAVEGQFAPGVVERVGMRYVTRVSGEGYERIDEMLRPELLGVAIPELRAQVTHAISEAAISVEEGDLMLRWGVLPQNGTVDPFVLEPVVEKSWVVDIDVSCAAVSNFDVGQLGTTFDGLAQRAYSVFRYMVTDQFLILHGGQL